MYFDNFYSSPQLIKGLFSLSIPSCGTAAKNRRSFPESMRKDKEWQKNKERGSMRWVRDRTCLAQQWKNNKLNTTLSSIHNANDYVMADGRQEAEDK